MLLLSGDVLVIAERPDKCRRSAAIWQCFLSSILVTSAQAAEVPGAARRLDRAASRPPSQVVLLIEPLHDSPDETRRINARLR